MPLSPRPAEQLPLRARVSLHAAAMKRVATTYRRLLVAVALFVALFAAFEVSGLHEHFSLAALREVILRHRAEGLVLFVLLFAAGNLVQVPGWVFLAAAVITLGKVEGGAVTYVAAVVSCAVTFAVVRMVGGQALRRIENPRVMRIMDGLDARPVTTVALCRMLVQTLPALNWALALSGIRFRSYIAGTLLGLPVPIALYCIFFDLLAAGLHLR